MRVRKLNAALYFSKCYMIESLYRGDLRVMILVVVWLVCAEAGVVTGISGATCRLRNLHTLHNAAGMSVFQRKRRPGLRSQQRITTFVQI
jgi:hypothetical protein